MEFDIADPPLPIMEFSIIFFIFLNEGFPKPSYCKLRGNLVLMYSSGMMLYFKAKNVLKHNEEKCISAFWKIYCLWSVRGDPEWWAFVNIADDAQTLRLTWSSQAREWLWLSPGPSPLPRYLDFCLLPLDSDNSFPILNVTRPEPEPTFCQHNESLPQKEKINVK